jgi:hypothetical protein
MACSKLTGAVSRSGASAIAVSAAFTFQAADRLVTTIMGLVAAMQLPDT